MTRPIRIELPTLFGMKTVNSYLFKEPEPVLIDCGEKSEASWSALNKALEENGLSIEDISKVIITHAHIDHMGMAAKITEHSQATIWVSEYAKEWAMDLPNAYMRRRDVIRSTIMDNFGKNNPIFQSGLTKVFDQFEAHWDTVPEDRLHIFPMQGQLEIGGALWDIVYAPGHCINQTCFYQAADKQLIAADMLLNITPSPVIDTTLEPPYERVKSLATLLESFEKFAAMEIDMVYPGHYEPFADHKTLITYQMNRIQTRKEECFQLIQSGTHHFDELLKELYKGRISMPAIPMLVGYLDLLIDEGRLKVEKKEDKNFYEVI